MSGSEEVPLTQETRSLMTKARALINEEFANPRSATPNRPNRPTGTTKSSSESVKDARKKIRKEWDSLKNASEPEDDSLEEKIKEMRRAEAARHILAGVVAYVEIPNRKRTDRAAFLLGRMGASLRRAFSEDVTHIVFKNGALDTYKRAKLLNVHLVSPLWVEACKNSKTRVLEKLFPVLDQNDYSNSPRIFRKFMEFQSKHFEYDENSGKIVRKTNKNPSIVLNMQNLQIDEADGDSDSSDLSLRLSSENSPVEDGLEQEADKENEPINPIKRRLFSKRPLEASFLKLSQTSSENERPKIVKNKIAIKDPSEANQKAHSQNANIRLNRFGKHRQPSLVTTSLHTHENIYVKNALSSLGGFKLKATVDNSTTHVIAGGPRRTVNILKGVARGCWILRKDWIERSAGAGRWLPEDRFELLEFSNIVRRSRIEKQAFGKYFGMDIFDECGPIYIGQKCEPSDGDLGELVTLCGGKLTSDRSSASIVVGEQCENKQCVSEVWILDSIMYGRYKSISKYTI